MTQATVIAEATYLPNQTMRKVEPNAQGVYEKFPVGVTDKVSRNQTFYVGDNFVSALQDPNSAVNRTLKVGQLYGEWGHPDVSGITHADKRVEQALRMKRMMSVSEDNASHHISRVLTGDKSPDGSQVIMADIKPFGPNGNTLKDSFENDVINTAFSLRAFTANTNQTMDGKPVSVRRVTRFITFDAVLTGGFTEASKAFTGDNALESVCVDIEKVNEDVMILHGVAMESFTDTELNEIFGRKTAVAIKKKSVLFEGNIDFDSELKTFAESFT